MKHACDLCGTTTVMPILAAMPYIGDQTPPGVCTNCGFVYVQDRRSPEEIAKSWDDIWGEGYSSKWPAVQARLYYVRQWIEQELGLPESLLDIGAGEGDFLSMFDRELYRVAIEPAAENRKRLLAHTNFVHTGPVETFDRVYQFDLITINWTLENCGDCVDMLRRAAKVCDPDGYVVVASGSRILVPYKKPLGSYFSKNPQDLHSFRFSVNSLGHAMRLAGLVPIKVNRHKDSDWLVMAGRPKRPGEGGAYATDNPNEVIDFFANWKVAFP